MLDFIFDAVGEVFFDLFFEMFTGMFSGLFSIGDRGGTEMLVVVPRLPAGAGVLLAKGGQ